MWSVKFVHWNNVLHMKMKHTHTHTRRHTCRQRENCYKAKHQRIHFFINQVWLWWVPLHDISVMLQSKSCTPACGDAGTDQGAFCRLFPLHCLFAATSPLPSVLVNKIYTEMTLYQSVTNEQVCTSTIHFNNIIWTYIETCHRLFVHTYTSNWYTLLFQLGFLSKRNLDQLPKKRHLNKVYLIPKIIPVYKYIFVFKLVTLKNKLILS